jgi:signal transduction histidine kinase
MKDTIADKHQIDRIMDMYRDWESECTFNPVFIFDDNQQLVWHNREFEYFASKVMKVASLEQTFREVMAVLKMKTRPFDREYNCNISQSESPEIQCRLRSHPLSSAGIEGIHIAELAGNPDILSSTAGRNTYNVASAINQLGRRLSESYKLDETLKIILIGATAGNGLGFNRAFLLRYDPDSGSLRGEMAIGPSNGEEAAVIWSELDGSRKSLDEIISGYNNAASKYDVRVNELVRLIDMKVCDLCRQVNDVIDSQMPAIITRDAVQNPSGCDLKLFDVLSVDIFAAAPLTVEGNIVGLLLADNLITSRPITDWDLEVLSIFANHAGAALERSRLYERLGEKIEQLARANETIRESQKKLIENEKMTAVGKMAFQVAHEIRNPLTVVGGYARNIRRKLDDNHEFSDYLDIIVNEVDRIESVLDNFTSVARAIPEENTVLDFSRLLKDVLHLITESDDNLKTVFKTGDISDKILVLGCEKQLRNALLAMFRQFALNVENNGRIYVDLNVIKNHTSMVLTYRSEDFSQVSGSKIFAGIFDTSPLKRDTSLVIANQIINQHGGMIGLQQGRDKPLSIYINLPVYRENCDA